MRWSRVVQRIGSTLLMRNGSMIVFTAIEGASFRTFGCRRRRRGLFGQRLDEEIGHHVVSLDSFGQIGVIPEGVKQRVEDDEARIYAGVQIGAVQVRRPAQ